MVQVVGEDKTVYKRVTCRNCGAVLEYTQNEVLKRIDKDYTGGCDVVYCISCPRCLKHVTVKGY